MVLQTLNGFAILDIIFGLVTLCFIVSDVTGDSCEGLLANYMHKFGKSTKAKASGHAPAKGAGKRGGFDHYNSKRLAVDQPIVRSETA